MINKNIKRAGCHKAFPVSINPIYEYLGLQQSLTWVNEITNNFKGESRDIRYRHVGLCLSFMLDCCQYCLRQVIWIVLAAMSHYHSHLQPLP